MLYGSFARLTSVRKVAPYIEDVGQRVQMLVDIRLTHVPSASAAGCKALVLL